MSAVTPRLGLYKPGGGSTGLITPDEVADIDRLNANSDVLDAWAITVEDRVGVAGSRVRDFRGPAANIGAVPSPVRGDTYQETDGNFVTWKHDGTNWITNEGGMFKIRPTSVSGAGASIGADGSIVFTAVSNVDVDIAGLFSSRFRNYRMVSRFTQKASVGIEWQGLVGATPVTAAEYFGSFQVLVNGSRQDLYAGAATTGSSNVLSGFSGAQGGATIDILTPNEAARTTFSGNMFASGGVSTTAQVLVTLENTLQLTGLRLKFTPTAAATGTLAFYGYS